MNKLWLFILPLMLLPNFGLAPKTPFGVLEVPDLLTPMILLVIALGEKSKNPQLYRDLLRPVFLFILWSLISVFFIYFRYDYISPIKTILFSGFKLAKFILYGYVGLSLSRLVVNQKDRTHLITMLCWMAIIGGLGLLMMFALESSFPIKLYKSENLMSVSVGILFTYISVLYFEGFGSNKWRILAMIAIGCAFVGMAVSGGRAGFLIACVVVGAYSLRAGVGVRHLVGLSTILLGGILLYNYNPKFQEEFDKTFSRDEKYLKRYKAGVGGVDDGARIYTWANEAPKLVYAPFMGTGFHHRGGQTRLWDTGSHNYWLQIVLETGLIGAFLFLLIIAKFWNHAFYTTNIDPRVSLAYQFSLLTCFLGNLSGEYLYGGICLFVWLAIYASIGSEEVHSAS